MNLNSIEKYVGNFDFKNNMRVGKGVVTELGKEFFVEYGSDGKEKSRKRTFEGVRLMIIGNRFILIRFLNNLCELILK